MRARGRFFRCIEIASVIVCREHVPEERKGWRLGEDDDELDNSCLRGRKRERER